MSDSIAPKKQVLTIKEVSHYLRIPVSTVYDLARAGKIKGRKFGKHWRFLEEDIVSYFHGNSPSFASQNSVLEHRQHPRVNMRVRAEVATLLSSTRSPVKGTIHNLSAGGVYFVADTVEAEQQVPPAEVPEPFNAGDPVRITFELPDAVPVRIEEQGRVIHRVPGNRLGSGIKFKHLHARDMERIQSYVG